MLAEQICSGAARDDPLGDRAAVARVDRGLDLDGPWLYRVPRRPARDEAEISCAACRPRPTRSAGYGPELDTRPDGDPWISVSTLDPVPRALPWAVAVEASTRSAAPTFGSKIAHARRRQPGGPLGLVPSNVAKALAGEHVGEVDGSASTSSVVRQPNVGFLADPG